MIKICKKSVLFSKINRDGKNDLQTSLGRFI